MQPPGNPQQLIEAISVKFSGQVFHILLIITNFLYLRKTALTCTVVINLPGNNFSAQYVPPLLFLCMSKSWPTSCLVSCSFQSFFTLGTKWIMVSVKGSQTLCKVELTYFWSIFIIRNFKFFQGTQPITCTVYQKTILCFYYSSITTAQREISELHPSNQSLARHHVFRSAWKHRKKVDFTLVESFTPFQRRVHNALRGIAV